MLQNIFHAVVEVPRWTNAKMEVWFHICFRFNYDVSGMFSSHTLALGVYEYDVHLLMKAWNSVYLHSLGAWAFSCSHKYDSSNFASKDCILFFTLLNCGLFFFLHLRPPWHGLAANLRAQETTGLPEPTTVFSNQRRADAVSSACPQQRPPWHTIFSQPLFGFEFATFVFLFLWNQLSFMVLLKSEKNIRCIFPSPHSGSAPPSVFSQLL